MHKFPIFYNSDYTASDFAFDTTRKSAQIADRLFDRDDVIVLDPSDCVPVAETLIGEVHDPGYVNAVRTGSPIHLAQSQGFSWDPKIYTMAVAHSSGLVAATESVLLDEYDMAGSLSSGLHHASRESGAGFCTFNGLAVAAKHAESLGAERILVLDFDAHCGGGTRSLLDPKHVQIDISTSAYDHWNTVNDDDRLFYADRHDYLDILLQALAVARKAGSFDFVIYNAGMDPANSGLGKDTLRLREQRVSEWLAIYDHKAIFALAGGYTYGDMTMEDLVDLHMLTIDGFSRYRL